MLSRFGLPEGIAINDRETDLGSNYPLPDNAQKTIFHDSEYEITKQFGRNVKAYIRANTHNLPFKSRFYKSTLVNYHAELGIATG